MAVKIIPVFLVLALAGGVSSQETKPETVKVDPATPKQEPKKPAEIDRIDELRSQLERARMELQATRRMAESGGLPKQVEPFLTSRSLAPRAFDLGIEVPEPPAPGVFQPAQPAKRTGIRMLDDAEKARLGDDVIFTVDGEPVTGQEFDDAFAYFRTRPNIPEETSKRDTIKALVIQKSAFARFKENAAEARAEMASIEQLLAGGQDFAEVAKSKSQCPSAVQGGDLGKFGRGMMDPMFEKVAYQTPVGETSDVFQSAFGYHIVKVTAHDEGEQEQVQASHILIMFDDDQNAIRQNFGAAAAGQVDLAFATKAWRDLSPF